MNAKAFHATATTGSARPVTSMRGTSILGGRTSSFATCITSPGPSEGTSSPAGGGRPQDDRTHPKKCLLAGQVGEPGIKLRCGDAALPTDSGRVEVNKAGNEGKIYTTYVPMMAKSDRARSL
jgi:hypothetical protein